MKHGATKGPVGGALLVGADGGAAEAIVANDHDEPSGSAMRLTGAVLLLNT